EGQLIVSTERAQAVADHLVYLGVREAHEISIAGYGADRPVADNDTQEGMAANRRVEIIILGN
ncbi:MAG: OmpA family protein, partial [Treponema sp.]|nr:OmpA family protein [Treponema sp.]